jgi:ATP-binding cassette subfamily F protein 3
VSFAVRQGEKVALIGRNGAGKSTILKLIAGVIEADGGNIDRPINMAYLKQEITLDPELTVMQAAYTAFERVRQIHDQLEKTIKHLEHHHDDEESLMHHSQMMAELYSELEHLDEANIEGNMEKVLKGLGFEEDTFHKKLNELSGGWQMRVELAKLLLSKPDYLLLDEPTNHLDMPSIIWLERYLKTSSTGVLLVSHDKRFLDQLTERTIEISLGRVYDMPHSYTKFMEERKLLKEIQLAAFQNQQKEIERKEKLIDRFRAKATKASMAQSLQKQLDKIEVIEIEEEDLSAMKVRFPVLDRSPRTMVQARHLSKSFGEKKVLVDIDFDLERNEKIAFVGQNGQGKSTLAKLIAGSIEASSGTLEVNEKVLIGHYRQDQTELFDPSKTVLETIEEKAAPEVRPRVRGILGAFLFSGDDSGKKVSVLSGGERARLALACMILSQTNLLIMDEPTHHLDILAKQRLKEALNEYPGSLIIISHDRDFLQGLTSRTIEFANGKTVEYLGDIDEMLAKKGIENLDIVSNSNGKEKVVEVAVKETIPVKASGLPDQEKRALQKKLSQLEKQIDKLEKEIQESEMKLADPVFFQSPEFGAAVKSYELRKTDLEKVTVEWEQVVSQLS